MKLAAMPLKGTIYRKIIDKMLTGAAVTIDDFPEQFKGMTDDEAEAEMQSIMNDLQSGKYPKQI